MPSLTGTVKVVGAEQQVSEKFRKRDIVITDNSSQYPQHIQFQATQDRCNIIDGCAIGQEVTVHFNMRGREWKDPKDGSIKYFNTLEAWKIDKPAGSSTAAPAAQTASEDPSDLPF